MEAPYTAFGKTRMVKVIVYLNNEEIESKDWDEEYWVERPEDWYGLMSSGFKNKKIRIIRREDWLNSKSL